MGAFQTGFQIGSSAAQAALDRKEREDRVKREEEERKLRLRQLELGVAEAERRAENNRRADAIDAEIVRGVGIDPGPLQSAPQAAAAPRPAVVSTGPAMPAVSAVPLATAAEVPGSTTAAGAAPTDWEQMTPEQQAQWYRENPRASAITRGLQYLWTQGTAMGRLQRAVDPVGVGRAVAVAEGDVGFFRPEGSRPAEATPSTSSPSAVPPAIAAPGSPQVASPVSPGNPAPAAAPEPAKPAAGPRYSDKAMNLFRMAESARLRGDRGQFQNLFEKGQEQVIDDVVNDFRKGYDGAQAQVDKSIELLNAGSPGITIGDADPKTGIRQASIVQPDKRALFLRLSRADQAELWAAGQLLQTNPDRAFKMIAGVNKTLAEVIKAENEQARAVMTANNQGAANASNVRRDDAYVANLARDDRRAEAAADARGVATKAEQDAREALFRQLNPNASAAQINAARLGVIQVVPSEPKVESTFTPNPLGGGGTVTQRLRDGRVLITPVAPDGKVGAPATIEAPGSAPVAAGTAARGGTSGVDSSKVNAFLPTVTTRALEETARSAKLPMDQVMEQLAGRMNMTVDQLQAVVYANDAREKQGAGAPAAAPVAAPAPVAPATSAAPPPGAIAPGIDLGPPRIPARPVPAAAPTSAAAGGAVTVAAPPAPASIEAHSRREASVRAPTTQPPVAPIVSNSAPAPGVPVSPQAAASPASAAPAVTAPSAAALASTGVRSVAPSASDSPAVTSSAQPVAPPAAPIRMSFKDAPTAAVARAVAAATGRQIKVDDDVSSKITVTAQSEEPPEEAFGRFVEAVRRAGLVVLNQRDGGIRIANPPRVTDAPPPRR
jgi:hypothetical protein